MNAARVFQSPILWDQNVNNFHAKNRVYVSHFSKKRLHYRLNQFIHAATCLQLVAITLDKVDRNRSAKISSYFERICVLCFSVPQGFFLITRSQDRQDPTSQCYYSLWNFLFFKSGLCVVMQGLQNIALKEEASTSNVDGVTTPTLLGLANSLSRFLLTLTIFSCTIPVYLCLVQTLIWFHLAIYSAFRMFADSNSMIIAR